MGKWVAVRRLPAEWCDIRQKCYAAFEYLHQDGVARESTFHEGEFTGYFTSYKLAESLIEHRQKVLGLP